MPDIEAMRLEIVERVVDLDDDTIKAMYFIMDTPIVVDPDTLGENDDE